MPERRVPAVDVVSAEGPDLCAFRTRTWTTYVSPFSRPATAAAVSVLPVSVQSSKVPPCSR